MKTKTFFLICLLLGMAITKISAQLPPVIPDGTKSVVWTFEVFGYEEFIFCNDENEPTDVLKGDFTFKEVDHFKNGEMTGAVNHLIEGIFTSEITNEVFKAHENIKGYPPVNEDGNYTNGTWHFNLKGDQGSHYIGFFSFYSDGSWTIDKFVCPGKK